MQTDSDSPFLSRPGQPALWLWTRMETPSLSISTCERDEFGYVVDVKLRPVDDKGMALYTACPE